MSEQRRNHRPPIRPDRIRKINGGFAFISQRFLHEGFLASLTSAEIELYFFLVLAADRQGLSFYHYDRICSLLQIDIDTYVDARNGLIEKDLLAFDGTRFQVLSLPERPFVNKPAHAAIRDHAEDGDSTIRRAILRNLRSDTEEDGETEDIHAP